jgi:hypothetical protein
MAEENLGCL